MTCICAGGVATWGGNNRSLQRGNNRSLHVGRSEKVRHLTLGIHCRPSERRPPMNGILNKRLESWTY